jgi:hypothetical protein
METKTLPPECQIHGLERMSEPLGRVEIVWQTRNRLKRIIKRRLNYLRNWFSEVAAIRGVASTPRVNAATTGLRTGDQVRVRSREEIQSTLNRWNRLKQTTFTEEMWPYCGTTQHILKRVDRFLDERDYRMKKCRGIVLLEGVICEGTKDYGRCDRSCYFFWREEWLEKIG